MSGYVSKDFINEGCGLILNPEKVWEFIPYAVQKNIKKSIRNNVRIEQVDGNTNDIEILKSMWYDPSDPNMPNQLTYNDFMFIAYNEQNEAIGAVILLPVGNHLFLNNLAGNRKGKDLGIQDFLLWHCVNYFKDSRFKYIDVGVSYRATLYTFFKKWKTFAYPVIFNVPEIKLDIPFYPFNFNLYSSDNTDEKALNSIQKLIEISGSKSLTFVPNEFFTKEILNSKGIEPQNYTFQINKINDQIVYVNLQELFSTQFGSIIFNLEIDDKTMWNEYHCLDGFKRTHVLSSIYDELQNFDTMLNKRNENFNTIKNLFAFEDIIPEKMDNSITDYFTFQHELNERYHNKLNDFYIKHIFQEDKNLISLPIHQNLNTAQLEYLYGIFRGILNLCSEWVHTDNYADLK